MDQQQNQARGRSPSAASHQQPHINQSHSPSPSPARAFNPNDPASTSNIGLGLGLDASSQQQQFAAPPQDYSAYNNQANFLAPQSGLGQDLSFDPNQPFTDQLKAEGQFNQSFLTPQATFNEDFTIFPTSSAEAINAPLFVGDHQQLGSPDMNTMAHHSPTPPHLLKPEPHQSGPLHQSPSFNSHQFSSPRTHSRNASLGPQDALLPGQLDWSSSQFQGHRRTPSEYSDASSVGGHSPNLGSQENFPDHLEHSPMQRPQDTGVYQELHGISNFSISDQSPNHPGRSPSHSPAISPQILPQSLPDMNQQNSFVLQNQQNGYGSSPYLQPPEAFPSLPSSTEDMQLPQMSAPTINIDYAPTASTSRFEGKSVMDTDALTPPELRGNG